MIAFMLKLPLGHDLLGDEGGARSECHASRSSTTASTTRQSPRSEMIAWPVLSDTGSRWPCSGRRDRDSFESWTAAPSPVWRAGPVLAAEADPG
jgi:hypothetical protein